MELSDAKFYLRKRYLVAGLVFLGWIIIYILRMNLSINIVDMTSDRMITIGNETFIRKAEFNWSIKEKGMILSSFFWGYAASPLVAIVQRKYGGVNTFGAGIALTGLLTIVSPVLIKWNLEAYLVARIFEGLFEGCSATTAPEVLRPWSTPAERSRLIGGVATGFVVGTMLGFPICGTIAYYFNWEAVFYITGGTSVIWCLIWFSLISDNPEKDKCIPSREQQYLKQVNPNTPAKSIIYPWRQIVKTKAVWAFWNDRFVEAWSTSFLTYCLPIYIKDVHNVNIQDIGILSGIPHFCGMVGMMGGAFLADYLRNRGVMSISNVYKLFLSVAQFSAVVLLVTAALWQNFLVNIICFCIFRLLFTITTVSYQILPVDLAGPYSCFVNGISYTCASISYSINPIVMGFIITDHSVAQWSAYFSLLSVFNLWGGLVFYKYGSGDTQSWAMVHDGTDDIDQRPRSEGNTISVEFKT